MCEGEWREVDGFSQQTRRKETGRTDQEDGDVVVNVEEGELVPLLPQDDEDGVHEVEHLCNRRCGLWLGRWDGRKRRRGRSVSQSAARSLFSN